MIRALFVALALGVAAPADAYSLSSPITDPCHERITAAALRAARAATGNAQPITPDRDEAALIADIPSPLDDDMRDLGGATLVLAISDNDLKGYKNTDEQALVPITADPELQHEHCLRRPDQDEPDGSVAALAECRAFIHERVAEALAALDGGGRPDPAQRTDLRVNLTIRGERTIASLPTYYVRMAQAMHALEDGFAHSFRTADQLAPTVVLNWSEQQAGTLDEQRDGPGHSLALDSCADADALRTLRRQVATQAATELLTATLTAGAAVDGKLAATDEVATRYLTLHPGCTFDNGWCAAPEAALHSTLTGCGCQLGAATSPAGGGLVVALVLVAALVLMRLRRYSPRGAVARAGRARIAVVVAIAIALTGGAARAQEAGAPSAVPGATPADRAQVRAGKEPGRDAPTMTKQEVQTTRQKKRLGARFGGQLTVAGAIDRAAASLALGGRFRLDEKWIFGLDAELNPFFGITNTTARLGAFNLYASVIRRYPMTWERVNLRTTLQAGLSTMLFDLYGAPAGSIGPYVGLSLLGLDIDLGRSVRLVFDPGLVTLPVPHVTGQPFYYLQYRVSIGLSFGG